MEISGALGTSSVHLRRLHLSRGEVQESLTKKWKYRRAARWGLCEKQMGCEGERECAAVNECGTVAAVEGDVSCI